MVRKLGVGEEFDASRGHFCSSDPASSAGSCDDDSEAPTTDRCRLRSAVAAGVLVALVTAAAAVACLAPRLSVVSAKAPGRPVKRVLFLGNSLTYVNDLPEQLRHIAAHFGWPLEVANCTIGGCTLLSVSASECSAARLAEKWDLIVVQDHSNVPLFPLSREAYMYPGIEAVLKQKGNAQVAAYMTFPYKYGIENNCPPTPPTLACWPKGLLRQYITPDCADPNFVNNVSSFECMGYAYQRAYLSVLKRLPVDFVVPAGIAWQLLRGRTQIPAKCKAAIDAQYEEPLDLDLVATEGGGEAMEWLRLHANVSDHVDLHPTRAGQYLDALTFYRMVYGQSSVGAPQPFCEAQCFLNDWAPAPTGTMEPGLTQDQLLALQHAADGAVEQCGTQCLRQPAGEHVLV